MFDLKIRPIKRVVEGRANFGGSNVLVTVTKRGYRFAINGPSVFRIKEEWEEFSTELNDFLDKATEIAREL